MKPQNQLLVFQPRRKSCCTPLILYWHSLKRFLPWVKNSVNPFWTVNLHKDFLMFIPIWLPVLSTFSSVQTQHFCVFFLSSTELVIWNFSIMLHTVLLHGTVDVGYFLQNFLWHYFHDLYIIKVWQINTFFFNRRYFWHALPTCYEHMTGCSSHVQVLKRGKLHGLASLSK